MNILKKSHVLNQNCLRDKIQELSPLLRNLDWPANKDSVFRAAWSYYASGCQERLTTIRRRIEQNARMVAPNKRIGAPLPVDLKLPFNESQLTPGLDADEHIYRELVSCFRNAKSTASIKKTPQKRSKIQRPFDMSKFSTPEQWINWKREEQQVGQLLKQSFDPYLKEEMSKKLQHLKKLTSRRPLLQVPNQKEIIDNTKVSHFKKRKSRQKYIDEIDKYKTNVKSRKSKSFTNLDENKLPWSSKKAPTKLAAKYELHKNLRKNDTKLAEKYDVHVNSRKNDKKLSEKHILTKSSEKTTTKLEDIYKLPSKSIKTDANEDVKNKPPLNSIITPRNKSPWKSKKTPKTLADKHKLSSTSRKIIRNLADILKQTNKPSRNMTSKLAHIYKQPSKSRKTSKILAETYKIPSNSRKLQPKIAGKLELHSKSRKSSLTWTGKYNTIWAVRRFIAEHPSLESIASSKRSIRLNQPRPKRIEKHSDSSEEDTGLYGIDYQLPIVDADSKSLTSQKSQKAQKIKRSMARKYQIQSQNLPKVQKLNTSKAKKVKAHKKHKNQDLKDVVNLNVEKDAKDSSSLALLPGKTNGEIYKTNLKISQRRNKVSKTCHFSSHTLLKSSKSGGSQSPLFKIPNEESNDEVQRQVFISTKRSSSLSTLQTPKRNVYIEEIMKRMSASNPTIGSGSQTFKDLNSDLSIYRGQPINFENQEIGMSIIPRGEHHKWPLNVTQHTAYVNPNNQHDPKHKHFYLNKRRHHEMARQEHEHDTFSNNEIALKPTHDIFANKQGVVSYQSKISLSLSETEVRLSLESKPLVIADLISKFMKSYASEISCFQSYPDWFKTNELDSVFIETVVKKKEPKEPKKIKKTKKRRVVETMEVEKTPSKPIKISCSLCNLVRRRQSELRPYMQRMQKERQRLELKTYYTQKLLKCRPAQELNVQEQKRACAREVLARCSQTLNLCQQILEQRRLKKCQLQQSEQIRKLNT
ncbi:uncharacterized protein LOC128253652 [Drosophila gunungcola]|uniref:uncharacterized protein LOC128253652 n=1 Tax=Drosophila gunungcola TaxID=103775 RepID=UPI0022E6B4EA|nr:uncharacterized protein LOC128253652 [Drosophila gunungcola]